MSKHELTAKMASPESLEALALSRSVGVEGAVEGGPETKGGVLLSVRAGDAAGDGVRGWDVVVGGEGLGADEDVSWGGYPRGPVLVRFAQPFLHMPGVDDAGICDGSFWKDMPLPPTLTSIAQRLVEWLQGRQVPEDDDEALLAWLEAQTHTAGKVAAMETFRKDLAPHAEALLGSGSGAFSPGGGVSAPPTLLPQWLAPGVRAFLTSPTHSTSTSTSTSTATVPAFAQELSPGIFAFDLFTPEFCGMLLAQVDTFEASALPRRRPNTMNNFGLVVNEIGWHALMTDLLQRLLAPLSHHMFPDEAAFVHTLDHHHSFVVQYRAAELGRGDLGLDMHSDASEVTLNVCLGRDNFEASELRFCGALGAPDHRRQQFQHAHRIGSAVVHLGRQRHGADHISKGERLNLIMWARSAPFRAAAAFGHIPPDGYPRRKEAGAPELACLSKANDPDYATQLRTLQGQQDMQTSSAKDTIFATTCART